MGVRIKYKAEVSQGGIKSEQEFEVSVPEADLDWFKEKFKAVVVGKPSAKKSSKKS